MKKLVLSDEEKLTYFIKDVKFIQNLTHEECSEVLQDFSEKFFSGDDIDPNLIELEEINGT
jgi:protein-arginine kinase